MISLSRNRYAKPRFLMIYSRPTLAKPASRASVEALDSFRLEIAMAALRLLLPAALMITGMTSACAQEVEPSASTPDIARASLIDRNRQIIGSALLQQGPNGILITVEMDGLPASAEGWHGSHLHEIGDCSNEDFTSSGGHINPDGRSHGLLNPDGPDNADLPNIYVHANGSARAQVFTDRVSLNGERGAPALLDADGSAMVFHANPDDHFSQPIGGAGPRIVCGVVEAALSQPAFDQIGGEE